jgi:hypothetical protein
MFRRLLALPLAALLLLSVLPMNALAVDQTAGLPDTLVAGFIDSPTGGTVLGPGQPFTINGWLVDQSSAVNVGIDAIGVSIQQAGQPTIDLGQARLALSRPDVAAALKNPNWKNAGYALEVPGLPAGTYTLAITARTVSNGLVNRTATVTVGEMTVSSGERWTKYGFNVDAPASMWPMLELLHNNNFDWALSGASRRPTPIRWDDTMPGGVYGQYIPNQNIIKLSSVLKSTSLEARAALLAHELTHMNDHLNGALGEMTGDACYSAESRAFVNEANLWSMLFGREGKQSADYIEAQENTKMWAFAGREHFADLVVRTTGSYVQQCSS